MLHPAKIKVFILFSILMHAAFALLFATVTLSFPPPPVKKLSLTIMTRGGGQGEIIQSEAAWPMPRRIEPEFSSEEGLRSFDIEIGEWMGFEQPNISSFSPKGSLIPKIEIAELAAKAQAGPPEELFARMPAESKARPLPDFALGPPIVEALEAD